MTGARAMWMIVLMALLCMVGLAGMVVADGAWDVGYFGLAMLPLIVGVICAFHWRNRTRRLNHDRHMRR